MISKLSIAQVVPRVGIEASGPSYSVPRLCESLGVLGHDVTLFSLEPAPLRKGANYLHHTYPASKVLWRLGASAQLRNALLAAAQVAHIVHNHSLWLMPNIYPAIAVRWASKPLVIAPRGTLSSVALARSRWAKKVFWAVLQGPAVRSAACLHATSEQEYWDIRRTGLRQPVAIVPNGIDIPPPRAKPQMSGLRTLLYLGRIHPIKGIDNLLRAWGLVADQFGDWQLRLVGPDSDGCREELERLAADLQLPRVEFAGPRYGASKQAEYAAAELYVLPSHSENFGMTVAEALAQGVPVIATTGTPWQKVSERACGWCVAASVAGLERALREALACDRPTLDRMGRAGRDWMAGEFSWPRIAGDWEQTYRWLLGSGPSPPFVRFD